MRRRPAHSESSSSSDDENEFDLEDSRLAENEVSARCPSFSTFSLSLSVFSQPAAISLARTQRLLSGQDDDLRKLHGALRKLRGVSTEIEGEFDLQHDVLRGLSSQTDGTEDQLQSATAQINRLLRCEVPRRAVAILACVGVVMFIGVICVLRLHHHRRR